MSVLIAFLVRLLLVGLFLPCSALDKVANFDAAVAQASEAVPARGLAAATVVAAFGVELSMSAAVLCGFADRAAALALAAYCVVTALLWKQFWRKSPPGEPEAGRPRELFWDFMKNLSLAGGFLLLTFGTDASGVERFVRAPLASSRPYAAPLTGAES